jgi:hypothetical protein
MRRSIGMALDKGAELVDVAKTLSLAERRRLVVELDELAAWLARHEFVSMTRRPKPEAVPV